jgi:hypothetical protein
MSAQRNQGRDLVDGRHIGNWCMCQRKDESGDGCNFGKTAHHIPKPKGARQFFAKAQSDIEDDT